MKVFIIFKNSFTEKYRVNIHKYNPDIRKQVDMQTLSANIIKYCENIFPGLQYLFCFYHVPCVVLFGMQGAFFVVEEIYNQPKEVLIFFLCLITKNIFRRAARVMQFCKQIILKRKL